VFGHLVFGPHRQAAECLTVFVDTAAVFAQSVDPEGSQPVGEASEEGLEPGTLRGQLTQQRLTALVMAVDGDDGLDTGPEQAEVVGPPVVVVDHTVSRLAVAGVRGSRLDGTDVGRVEVLFQAADVGHDLLESVDERPGVERFVDVGGAPAGKRINW
jgi:hypothetical protein